MDYEEGKGEDNDVMDVDMEIGGHFRNTGAGREKWMIRSLQQLWAEEI